MRSPQSLAASFAALPGVSSWVTPTSTSRPGSPMAPATRPSTVTLARLTRCTTARTTALPSQRPSTDPGNAVRPTLSSQILASGRLRRLGLAGGRDGPGRLGAAGHSRPGEPGDAPRGRRARDQFHGDLARSAAQPLVIDDQVEQRLTHRLHDRERGKEARPNILKNPAG